MKQPVPKVSDADVSRISERDFPAESQSEVARLMAKYGTEEWHREIPRVRLAVLKLSACKLDALEKYVEIACMDYRDVLLAAEYSHHHAKSKQGKFARGESAAAIAADWKEYSDWLAKS